MASALFTKAARVHGAADALSASAGLLESGQPVHPTVVELLDEQGIDVSRKQSQQLAADVVDKADLILAMTSEHARRVVSRFPSVIGDVYTQRHFGAIVTPRPRDVSTRAWLDGLNQRNPRSYIGDDEIFDIPDPIGQKRSVFVELSIELQRSTDWIMGCAYPPTGQAQVG